MPFFSQLASQLGDAVQQTAQVAQNVGGSDALTALSQFSDSDLVSALRETLIEGLRGAIARLSAADGFYRDMAVHISMPKTFAHARSVLQAAGQQGIIDQIDETINRAAERAVAAATDVLVAIVQGVSLSDVRNIIAGPPRAATEYLELHAAPRLFEAFHPIVSDATKSVGATDAVKRVDAYVDVGAQQGGIVGGLMGAFQNAVGLNDFDLDAHVTKEALKGLFVKIGEVEQHIRADPSAAASGLVQSVFRSVQTS